MRFGSPESKSIKVGGVGYIRLELKLKYDTSDIRQTYIKENKSFVILKKRDYPPPRPVLIRIHRSKNNRAYYTCPVCGKHVFALHYPYSGSFDHHGVWRCNKCMADGRCGDAVYLFNPLTKCSKLIDFNPVTLGNFYPSRASNGYSHKKLTHRIVERLKILKKTPNDKAIAKLNSPDTVDCPKIDTDDSKTLGELQALYALRNRIIAGELPYSKAALTQALNEAVAQ